MQADSLEVARVNAFATALPETYQIEIENEDTAVSEFWVTDGHGGWKTRDA